MKKKRVGIIGAGNMGEAIIKGLLLHKKFEVCVCEKKNRRAGFICRGYRVKKMQLEQLTKPCDVIIICVKPQDIDKLLSACKMNITKKHILISIAAGIKTAHIESFFKTKVSVVRVMPNMPGLVGEGISVYCLGKNANNRAARITEAIFRTMGEVLKTTEVKMNAVTAVSGSGPGFVAYLMEGIREAALAVGLNKKEAKFFSLYVTYGTGNMLVQEYSNPSKLVDRVASKGGTTEAGLVEFKKGKIKNIIKKAIKAATKRAEELSR